ARRILSGEPLDDPNLRGGDGGGGDDGGGGRDLPGTGAGAGGGRSFAQQFRDSLAALADALAPYERATSAAAAEVQRLAAMQAVASTLLESGIDRVHALAAAEE